MGTSIDSLLLLGAGFSKRLSALRTEQIAEIAMGLGVDLSQADPDDLYDGIRQAIYDQLQEAGRR